MSVTAAMVKELRERTGAGMMECKKALVISAGDIESAIVSMRESGQVKAAKKAGRIAAEGVIVARSSVDAKHAIMIEINSETDFVSRDESFTTFANHVAAIALAKRPATIEALGALTYPVNDQTIEEARLELISKIGENIHLRRIAQLDAPAGVTAAYLHGGRIGVLVSLTGNDIELAKDVAMHIAALKPEVINPEDVPADLVEQEKSIFIAQAQESGKPADIIEKMIGGRVQKFLNEVSLVGQPFVKDPNITVGKLLSSKGVRVVAFQRFEVGEGIEKKVEDFAAEVMAQVRGV
jgi:elongation factor Ts